MSSIESIIVVVLIVLIIGGVSTAVIFNKHYNRQIVKLAKQAKALDNIAIKEDIKRLEKMGLSGESLKKFNNWKTIFQEVDINGIATINNLLEKAVIANAKYSLFRANKLIKQAQKLCEDYQSKVIQSKDIFTQLIEATHDNQVQYTNLIKQYQDIRKNILANSFNYELSLNQLENNLTSLEKDFDRVKSISNKGDHDEAKKLLNSIEKNLSNLESNLPIVKEYENSLKQVFPRQLDEILATYKKMMKENFFITEIDVETTIKDLRKQIDENKGKLGKLEVNDVKSGIQRINDSIDELYALLSKELKARPFVDKNRDKIVNIFGHIVNNSANLVSKLEHIDESYELTHGELKEGKELESRVNHLNVTFDKDCQKLADGQGVYSEIEGNWLALLQELESIGDRQKIIFDDVDGLFDAEEIANNSIEHFKQEVSLIYRKVERRSLPGKSESFVQMYTLVVNEIAKTSEELDQVRINLEKISNKLIQIQEDIDRLQREADEIVSSADLVELTMQYSNKYLTLENIKKARKEAYDLYQNKFEFKEALDIIATALEKVEPGAYQKIEKDYYSDKNKQDSNNN